MAALVIVTSSCGQAQWMAQNSRAQDFYGKVIDQHGDPVAGVTATGTALEIQGVDVGEKRSSFTTTTDALGNFQFTGLHGWRLNVEVQRAGYEMKVTPATYRPPNPEVKTTAEQRVTFVMWKLTGPEPMVHANIRNSIPCDGTATHFDLLTGRRVKSGGDLTVRLTRTPLNIDGRTPFDWNVTFEVEGGGLVPITDLYPNEAPASGYQSSITFERHAGDQVPNPSQMSANYYFKARDGKVFGRVAIRVYANFQPPPTAFRAEIFANPAGSRILEFDESRQLLKP